MSYRRDVKSRLAAASVALLALAFLVPAGPANAGLEDIGQMSVPITLTTVPVGAPTFLVTYYDKNGIAVRSQQSPPLPSGTQSYTMTVSPDFPGTFFVAASAYVYNNGVGDTWGRMFAGNTPFFADSDRFVVSPGEVTAVPTITLEPGAKIQGTVTMDPSLGTTWAAATLELYLQDEVTSEYRHIITGRAESDGFFSEYALPTGTYLLRARSTLPEFAPLWRHDEPNPDDGTPHGRTQAQATPFAVGVGTTTANIAIEDFRTYDKDRLEGANRYATAVAITQELFPGSAPTVPVLYVTNGSQFPDALAAGPAASEGGGAILPVTQSAIPDVVLSEIERLQPERIVVAGGEPTVSAAVFTQLQSLAPEVVRSSGANRFATSRALAWEAFGCEVPPCGVQTAFIVTGGSFPDALSAGPAAALLDAPVILVNGGAGSLDDETRTLLEDLGTREVYVLGQTNSVSAGIESGLTAHGFDVTRIAGPNRYATSAQLAITVFGRSDRVYGASGAGFADALAGGPLAAAHEAPILLARATCGPASTYGAVLSVDAFEITYLGSTATIGDVLLLGDC